MASLENHFGVRGPGLPDGYGRYPFRRSFTLIEDYLKDLSFSENPRFARLIGAMRYAFLAGGERVRPVLCMEVSRSFGTAPADVLPSAAAIELIHTASAIHGDMFAADCYGSRSEMRSCHQEFGDATAILAGDACFSESVALISNHQKGTPGQILDVIRELAAVTGVGGVMGGQMLNITNRDGRELDPEALESMHNYGTGVLIGASARIGAILAGASAKEKEDVSEYARQFSLCLRIASDILEADSAGEDREKNSFVRVYGLSEAWRLADEALREALEALSRLDADTRGLAEMVRLARFGKTASVI